MPATAFAEPDKTTPKGNMMWRWAIDEANTMLPEEQRIDKAMPVMLMTADDVERWLTGTSIEDALTPKMAP